MSIHDIEKHEKFLFTLEWLLAVRRRFPGHLQFSLALIDYGSPQALGETYGAQKASEKLSQILLALDEAFRKTDIVTHDGCDFWVLAPYLPNSENWVEKISDIVATASRCGLEIVERNISFFVLPAESNPGIDACHSGTEVLAYLKRNRHALALREASLAADQ